MATTAQECYKLAEDVEWLLRNYPVSVQSITVHFEAKRKAEKLILEQLAITKTFDDCWILFKAIPQNIREYSELTTQIIKKALCYATVRECSYVHLDASNNRGMEKVGRQQAERLTREQLTRATSFQECKVVLDEAWSSPEVVSDVWEKATQYAASLDEWQVCFKAIRKMVGVHVDQIAERRSSCIRAMAAIIAETSETQG